MTQREAHEHLRTHQLQADAPAFALGEEMDLLRQEAASSNGRAAKTLVKEGPLRVILLAMVKGALLRDHHVAGPLTLQVIQGSVRIATSKGSTELALLDLVALDANVVHNAEALEDAALLLTIAMA